jgi:hypothetical protein
MSDSQITPVIRIIIIIYADISLSYCGDHYCYMIVIGSDDSSSVMVCHAVNGDNYVILTLMVLLLLSDDDNNIANDCNNMYHFATIIIIHDNSITIRVIIVKPMK